MSLLPDDTRSRILLAFGGVLFLAGLGVALRALTGESGETTQVSSAPPPKRVAPSSARPRPEIVVTPTGPALTGQVLDLAGQPVPGVTLGFSLEETLGPAVQVVEVQSDSEGRFRANLAAGGYRVEVSGDVVVDSEVRYVAVPGQVEIVITRRVEVTGRVVGGGGSRVWLEGEGIGRPVAATANDDGAFSFPGLPSGRYRVWAIGPGTAARAVGVERVGPGPFAPAILLMEPARQVVGRVVTKRQSRGVPAVVEISDAAGVEPARRGTTDALGRFTLSGVHLGTWVASAQAPGFVLASAVTFEGRSEFEPELVMVPGGVMQGLVVDSRDRPVEGASVVLFGRDELGGRTVMDSDSFARSQVGASAFASAGELGVTRGPVPPLPPLGLARVAVPKPMGEVGAKDDVVPVLEEMTSTFVTDALGQFRVAGLGNGAYQVEVRLAGFAPTLSPPFRVTQGEETAARIVLSKGAVLRGLVREPDGTPIVAAVLTLSRLDTLAQSAVTGSDGRFEIGPISGEFELQVTREGFGGASLSILVGGDDENVDVELTRADASLAGDIVDAAGFPVRDAVVRAKVRGLRARVPRESRTDTHGHFSIGQLPRGEYDIVVTHSDFPRFADFYTTDSPVEIRLLYGGGVAGSLSDERTGVPLAAFLVAEGPGDGPPIRRTASVRGEFVLAPLRAGEWVIRADMAGYASQEIQVEVPEGARPKDITVPDIKVEMDRGARVAGVVRGGDGERIAGASVRAGLAEARTDANGRYELEQVASGRRIISARDGDASGALEITLAPGDNLSGQDIVLE